MAQRMPGRPPSGQVSGWKVDSQTQVVEADVRGAAVRGVRVYFTTAGGHAGSVFVTEARYTPDNVRAAITEQAVRMDEIGNLQG